MNTLEVLRSTRKLLSDPKRWTKGHWHGVKEIDGEQVHCHCVEGAVAAACGIDVPVGGDVYGAEPTDAQMDQFREACAVIINAAGTKKVCDVWSELEHEEPVIDQIPDWNDSLFTSYEDVMSVMSKACEAAFEESVIA